MKNDLLTAIISAILGFVIAYLVCDMVILQPIESVTIKKLETSTTAELESPDVEVFNYRALNPTVEVYVGDCSEYNEYGECVDSKNDSSSNSTDTTDDEQENE